ncbi:MAG: DUF2750 domain-containing protein [Actinomycetota bacterium]|nr:DUF2750 domain-containing protein [Actinomycetota bacterium]
MSWPLSEQEFQAALQMKAPQQFQYFVERCVESETVWGLSVDGGDWGMTHDPNGLELFAVWPHERFAAACRHLHWSHRTPTPLRLDDFLDLVIPKLIADVVGVAVFPLPHLRCTAVDARQLRGAFDAELWRAQGH